MTVQSLHQTVFAILCASYILTDIISAGGSDSSSSTDTCCSEEPCITTQECETSSACTTKCDPYIVAKIYERWDRVYGKGQWPTNVIEKAISNGKEVAIRCSRNYYLNIACLYSYFHYGYVTLNRVYPNGTCSAKNVSVEECEGRTIGNSSGTGPTLYRYHAYEKDGVTAIYNCAECGARPTADKQPDGFIKVAYNNYSCEAVEEALKFMDYLGIKMVESYPLECECKECNE